MISNSHSEVSYCIRYSRSKVWPIFFFSFFSPIRLLLLWTLCSLAQCSNVVFIIVILNVIHEHDLIKFNDSEHTIFPTLNSNWTNIHIPMNLRLFRFEKSNVILLSMNQIIIHNPGLLIISPFKRILPFVSWCQWCC